jgi:adenylylsulfate kinase
MTSQWFGFGHGDRKVEPLLYAHARDGSEPTGKDGKDHRSLTSAYSQARREGNVESGFVVWFTGLSAAGKSTLAHRLEWLLRQRGLKVEVLDGDAVRTNLSKGLGFSKEDRDANIRRIGFVCKLLARKGVAAIAAAISPYREVRDEVRREIGDFVEVYVKCPMEVLMGRDAKGLYARALRGEIPNFTGISDPYEEPLNPEVTLETDKQSVEESLATLVTNLEELGYLKPERAVTR